MTEQALFTPTGEPTAIARGTDPDTSHAAARSVRNIRETQRVILDLLLCHGPLTDVKIAAAFQSSSHPPVSPSGLRTRRAELVDAGLITDTGVRHLLPSGRRAIVWGLTYLGTEAVAA